MMVESIILCTTTTIYYTTYHTILYYTILYTIWLVFYMHQPNVGAMCLGLGHGPRAFTATGITSVTGYVLPRRGVFWRCVLIDRGCVLKVCPGGAS